MNTKNIEEMIQKYNNMSDLQLNILVCMINNFIYEVDNNKLLVCNKRQGDNILNIQMIYNPCRNYVDCVPLMLESKIGLRFNSLNIKGSAYSPDGKIHVYFDNDEKYLHSAVIAYIIINNEKLNNEPEDILA